MFVGPVDIGDNRPLPDFSSREQGFAHGLDCATQQIPESRISFPRCPQACRQTSFHVHKLTRQRLALGMDWAVELVVSFVPCFMPVIVHSANGLIV